MTDKSKREYSRSRGLIIKYGITAREYDRVALHQVGRCAICIRPPKKARHAVEHRHSDGLFRGLVCWQCNKAIAYLRDDPQRAKRLLDFLVSPPAVAALGREVFGRTGRVSRRWRTKREKAERMAMLKKILADDKEYYRGR